MTTYCIDENKNLVNTLALSKREFTFNIQITSPIKENTDTWSFPIEYDMNIISFLELYKDNILAVNISGTLIYDSGESSFPAYLTYSSSSSSTAIIANISFNGYEGNISCLINSILPLVVISLTTSITTPTWVQGETYTLVITFYVAS